MAIYSLVSIVLFGVCYVTDCVQQHNTHGMHRSESYVHVQQANAGDIYIEQDPVCLAVLSGNFQSLVSLVESGYDVNRWGVRGTTPLHDAVRKRRDGMVQYVLRHGASVMKKQCLDGATPLKLAIEAGDVAIVRRLLEHGADSNVGDIYAPAMHHAVDKPDIIKVLLAYHANIRARDGFHATPLHVAQHYPVMLQKHRASYDTTARLLSYGASVAEEDMLGDTPGDIVATCDNESLVSQLIPQLRNLDDSVSKWSPEVCQCDVVTCIRIALGQECYHAVHHLVDMYHNRKEVIFSALCHAKVLHNRGKHHQSKLAGVMRHAELYVSRQHMNNMLEQADVDDRSHWYHYASRHTLAHNAYNAVRNTELTDIDIFTQS